MTTFYADIRSPVGPLRLVATAEALTAIEFASADGPPPAPPEWEPARAPFDEAIRQLSAYFRGALRRFDLPLAPEGTAFQQAVWTALGEIPFGETVSYGALARQIGRPRAVRAVGAANGRNPIPIVIPCHRVIGSDGRLTGYGGGLPVKAALLALERRTLEPLPLVAADR
jgi:methylated-DNA-[protein]-cysteine S-methyltransferase